jgi:hypothetical protein
MIVSAETPSGIRPMNSMTCCFSVFTEPFYSTATASLDNGNARSL